MTLKTEQMGSFEASGSLQTMGRCRCDNLKLQVFMKLQLLLQISFESKINSMLLGLEICDPPPKAPRGIDFDYLAASAPVISFHGILNLLSASGDTQAQLISVIMRQVTATLRTDTSSSYIRTENTALCFQPEVENTEIISIFPSGFFVTISYCSG
jgi:hypothetical protein